MGEIVTREEWQTEATRRFGPHARNWRFVCPACGFEQSAAMFEERTKLTVDEIRNVVAFSCIGRWDGHEKVDMGTKPGPCNYAGGGLFPLNPVAVEVDGKTHHVFAFAESAEFVQPGPA